MFDKLKYFLGDADRYENIIMIMLFASIAAMMLCFALFWLNETKLSAIASIFSSVTTILWLWLFFQK